MVDSKHRPKLATAVIETYPLIVWLSWQTLKRDDSPKNEYNFVVKQGSQLLANKVAIVVRKP